MLLIESPERLSIRNQLRFNSDYKEICEFFPQLTGPPDSSSAEIEKIANIWFTKIYKEEIKVPEAIEIIRKFKHSNDAQEREVYACMITGLLDEGRFHKLYPPKELYLTGIIFGQIIIN